MYTWSRYSNGVNDYECSSLGDRRLSAMYAKLKDGRIIEEIYQLDIKGNGVAEPTTRERCIVRKQKANGQTRTFLWQSYKELWRIYLDENPDIVHELLERDGLNFTDTFAKYEINQARAICEIMNEILLSKSSMSWFGEYE